MPDRASSKAHREAEDSEKAKEREFYRYYNHSQRPKIDDIAAQSLPHAAQDTASSETPSPSFDKALTAFAQLGALRLNARRCLISFFDRRNCYILAEGTRTLSLETGQAQFEEDRLCWGTSVLPKHQSICYYTVNLPVKHNPELVDDFSHVPTLVVNDLSADDRFKDYPFVCRHPYSRFYAGVPIRSPYGYSIGTYCVLDEQPRDGLSAFELSFLKEMAVTVMRHLEMTRATDDHRRRGVMVRSLGSFAEGKSNIEDWWHDPWETETTINAPENETVSRQRPPTPSKPPAPPTNLQDPFIRIDSSISASPSAASANLASLESGAPGSTVITPATDALPENRASRPAAKTASSKQEGPAKGKTSPEIRATFSRAANFILQATEADGAVFFDAKVSTFGGLVDDELPQEQPPDLIEQNKPCSVLGAAPESSSSPISPISQDMMHEAVLRHLLRTYPHGQIFNFDEDIVSTAQDPEELTESGAPSSAVDAEAFLASTSSKRPESTRSQDDEKLLREAFPKARSLVLYSLWDAHRDRWFAGAIIWSSDPMRVFTSEQELSYLAAFSNSIMAEVARLDTKLADAAKGDFISSISHELRSPLHGILGSCELLRDTQMDAWQSSMAQTIETCGKTLLDTINHVLDYAKINSLTRGTSKRSKKRSLTAKNTISPTQNHTNDIMTLVEDVNLLTLVEEVLETVFAGFHFQTKAALDTPNTKSSIPPIAVIVDIAKSDNFVFRTQPGAWRRVLMNIFGNALKYTPAGFIKVKLQVTPSSNPHDERWELRLIITDSGIGMSEDYVNNRLFHSFVQENPLSQGTGLGLAIVKQIVESLGGDIEVQSQKDHGTKFTVYCSMKLSASSPDASAVGPQKELLTISKRTKGMNVCFVGFDEDSDYFPVKSLKNKNATVLALKALDNLCTDWLGMKTQKKHSLGAPLPDLFVATESGAKWLRTQYSKNPESTSTAPVIVVCQGAASAQSQSTTAITVPGQIFECISQPCGPQKLAKALSSCLDRHANRIMAHSTDTDSAVPDLSRLSQKENMPPISPQPLRPLPILPKSSLSGHFGSHRPPISTALSAPEVRSVNSSPVKQPVATRRALHCLAVDDNPINLRLLRTFVEKLHHTHGLATNGLEALSTYKTANSADSPEQRFDVVLMDINMPEMDGLEATRQIRAYEKENGLPPVTIIALTGVASTEAQQEAHVSGVNLFLIKPVRIAELDTVLNGVIIGDDKKKEEAGKKRGEQSKEEDIEDGAASPKAETGLENARIEELKKEIAHKKGKSIG